MSEYQKQAQDFLDKYSIKFSVRFIKHDLYFDGDTQSRDIYRFTFRATKYYKRSFSGKFGQSIASTGTHTKPTAYSVLACLTKSDPDTFENFCGEFGYDTDSRRAEKTYKLVCKEWKKVRYFFTQAELEELQEIN